VRYVDPDSGRTVWKTIPEKRRRTRDDRDEYAIELSQGNEERRRELAAGAAPLTGLTIEATVDRYFKDRPELDEKTRTAYRFATDKLVAWCKRHHVATADDLNRAALVRFRASLVAAGKGRSRHTVNRDIRSTRSVLRHLADADAVARLSHDDIRRALKELKAPVERKEFLRTKQIQRLLESAQRHDAEVYDLTREERRAGKARGQTPKFEPVSGLVLFVLLSGTRLHEAVELEWSNVDLEALGSDGEPCGEVYIGGAHSKTKQSRVVDLSESPSLRRLLAAEKLRSGGKGRVFGLTRDVAINSMRRLKRSYGAPDNAGWQALRVTTGTYLVCAPSIYGSAAIHLAARRLGHSASVAQQHYHGALRGISPEARTLEAAMQVEKQADAIIGRLTKARAA